MAIEQEPESALTEPLRTIRRVHPLASVGWLAVPVAVFVCCAPAPPAPPAASPIASPSGAQAGAVAGATSDASAASATSAACDGPHEHELDFWVGSWDATVRARASVDSDAWGEARGRNDVEKTLGGCVVQEHFAADGPAAPWHGTSVSRWVAGEGRWRQTWVDDQGSYLAFTGGPTPEGFVFTGEPSTRAGVTSQMRMTFRDVTPGGFAWSWERTVDGGRTWKAMMTIAYVRRP